MEIFRKKHRHGKLAQTGICLHENLPFFVGLPDCVLPSKSCCVSVKKYLLVKSNTHIVYGTLELKVLEALEYLDENKQLKKSHTCYFQQNLYCGLNNESLCYFIIWTLNGHLILEINFDPELYKVDSLEKDYYKNCITQFYK